MFSKQDTEKEGKRKTPPSSIQPLVDLQTAAQSDCLVRWFDCDTSRREGNSDARLSLPDETIAGSCEGSKRAESVANVL